MDFLSQLEEMIGMVEEGDPASADELCRICGKIRSNPEEIPQEQVGAILKTISDLVEITNKQRDKVGAELAALGKKRRGLRGYSGLRSAKTAQRLSRQA